MGKFDKSSDVATDMIFKFIKDRMKEKQITQFELAEMIGINESTLIRNFKKETAMPLATYLKICGALELRPYLIPAEADKNYMQRMFFN
ncbi:helix-turn-helix domain-containing protein [Christiangramia forsetii]|uniref:HTH_3 family transcriptional regulator protein n=2 Tax=Christiangramia forsetii TaxID=411153 RepID=A0M423_CHRFK|nr:helix-turn-helix transcriptional regulator [Christiangramia forsetii]GGG24413.1 hypothetical protein GCM10011532_04600 [Christiangramia forsetii]CAL67368.1 hypothetical protein GFO_2412 [Christiangramia forsetii KT0803]